MTLANLTVQQLSRKSVLLTWQSDTVPVAGFSLKRTAVATGTIDLATVNGQQTQFDDSTLDKLDLGASVDYHLIDLDTLARADFPSIIVADLSVPYTYAPPNYLASAIRYTTLADVKLALGINDDLLDDQITQAVVALEVMIDVYCGQAFPSTGANPWIQGIPEMVKQAALVGGIEIFKHATLRLARQAATVTASLASLTTATPPGLRSTGCGQCCTA